MNFNQVNLLKSKLLSQLQKDNPLSSPSVDCYIPNVTIVKNAIISKEVDVLALRAVQVDIVEQETCGMDFSCLLELINEVGFCVNLKIQATKLPDLSKTSIRVLSLSALSGEIIINGDYSSDEYLTGLSIENATDNTFSNLPELPLLRNLLIDSNRECNIDFSKLTGFKELSYLALNNSNKYNFVFKNMSIFKNQLETIVIVNNAVSPQDICHLASLTKQIEISQMDIDFKDFGDVFKKNVTWKFSSCNFYNEDMVLNFENILVHQGIYKNKKWVTLKQFIAEGSCQEKIGDTYHFAPAPY